MSPAAKIQLTVAQLSKRVPHRLLTSTQSFVFQEAVGVERQQFHALRKNQLDVQKREKDRFIEIASFASPDLASVRWRGAMLAIASQYFGALIREAFANCLVRSGEH